MSDATPSTYFRKNITEIASLLVAGIAVTALLTGQSWWLAALLIGYLVVVPLVTVLVGDVTDWKSWWYDYVWGGDDWLDDLWDELRDDLGVTHSKSADEIDDDKPSNRDALETLRDRYARGELTDEQFERKLEQLLETETLENVEDRQRERLHERE